ncbi:MAG: CRISPR-associated endoribonuclease Cas6 [Tannerellaceae bacterium]|nr:CRISPR-associated endoribonuclease Cas6 [Tannerellaceae bacterium]
MEVSYSIHLLQPDDCPGQTRCRPPFAIERYGRFITITVQQETFLSPEAENYGQLLVNNLKEKYRAFYQESFAGDPAFEFKLLSPPKSKLITIKADSPSERTKVRGYHFHFTLKADPQLLEIMYEAGAGEKGSLGFGMVECVAP